jgi:ABC-type Fe3+/spermidine/putrescine transport system ATPase subunit
VQRELGITTVLVTHDQEEAFALADTIGVMNHGRLLEVGHPHDLYAQPATRFVATFLGAANLLLARQGADGIRFGAHARDRRRLERLHGSREHEVVAVLRPEEVELADHASSFLPITSPAARSRRSRSRAHSSACACACSTSPAPRNCWARAAPPRRASR